MTGDPLTPRSRPSPRRRWLLPLAAAAWTLALPASSPVAAPGAIDIEMRDLGAVVAEVARTNPGAPDCVLEFYRSDAASLHLHVLGAGQTTPLHVHRANEEATVIVTGTPVLTFEFGDGGRRRSVTRRPPAGAVVVSPANAGHEWFNPSADATQANLVFASPPFDGNLYLKPGDPRMIGGTEPVVDDPDKGLRDLRASGQPSSVRELPVQGSKVAALLVAGSRTIPAHPRSPTFLYVSRGRGTLTVDATYRLGERALVSIPAAVPFTVTADPGAPLALVAFRPEP